MTDPAKVADLITKCQQFGESIEFETGGSTHRIRNISVEELFLQLGEAIEFQRDHIRTLQKQVKALESRPATFS